MGAWFGACLITIWIIIGSVAISDKLDQVVDAIKIYKCAKP
jgi:hypothetical protein